MRNIINSIGLGLALALGTVGATAVLHPTTAHAQDYYIDYNDFYNGLAPYGDWFQDPEYGYVWMPRNVGANFRPYYTNGYWTMTEYGNMWISNYAWGWAPFNYGRWALRPYGWIWVPGTEWAPAWVVWREGGGYYGWAPMAPGIQMNAYFNNYNTPYDWFTFVPYANIYNRNFSVYYVPNNFYNRYWNRTAYIRHQYANPYYNNSYFWTGPSYNEVKRYNRNVQVNRVTRTNTQSGPRIEGNNVRVYNPAVRTNSANARPREVRDINTITNTRENAGAIRTTTNTTNATRNTTERVTPANNNIRSNVQQESTNRNIRTTTNNATSTPVRQNVNTNTEVRSSINNSNTIRSTNNNTNRTTVERPATTINRSTNTNTNMRSNTTIAPSRSNNTTVSPSRSTNTAPARSTEVRSSSNTERSIRR